VFTATNVLVLLAMLVGTVGIIVPILPGLVVVWAATLFWALEDQSTGKWVVLGVATAVYVIGLIAQFVVPGRRMVATGVRSSFVALALVAAVIGLFVIPVIGAPIFFLGTIYLLERVKHRVHARAWSATKQAVRAVLLSMGIELATAVAIIATWVAGVLATRP